MWNYKVLQDGKCAIGYSGRFDGVVSSDALAVAVCAAFNDSGLKSISDAESVVSLQ